MKELQFSEFDASRDTNKLYSYMDSEDQYLFSSSIHFNSEENFGRWLYDQMHHYFHDYFTVLYRSEPIGYVYNFDFSLVNGNCKLVIFIEKKYRQFGMGGIVAINYMNYLFQSYPLKKLYSTIYDYNTESLQSNLKAGFIEEGCLKDFRYYNGAYHSMHILSMTRDSFDATLGRFVESDFC